LSHCFNPRLQSNIIHPEPSKKTLLAADERGLTPIEQKYFIIGVHPR